MISEKDAFDEFMSAIILWVDELAAPILEPNSLLHMLITPPISKAMLVVIASNCTNVIFLFNEDAKRKGPATGVGGL